MSSLVPGAVLVLDVVKSRKVADSMVVTLTKPIIEAASWIEEGRRVYTYVTTDDKVVTASTISLIV